MSDMDCIPACNGLFMLSGLQQQSQTPAFGLIE